MDRAKQKWNTFRAQLWDVLQHGKGHTGHAFNFSLLVLILVSLAILPLEFAQDLNGARDLLLVIEIVITAIFTAEYLLRILAAPHRLAYIFSFFGIVDFLSIAPFYAGLLGTQYLRVFRLIRLLRVSEVEAAAAAEEPGTMEEGIGLVPGERVEHVVTRHPVFLLLSCIPPLLAISAAFASLILFTSHPITITIACTLILFGLLFLWKAWLDYSYDVIYITSNRLIFQNQHILGRDSNQVNYRTITNVKPRRPGIMSYLLRYGSLVIETPAAEKGHIELHMVRAHEHAAKIIMQMCASIRL